MAGVQNRGSQCPNFLFRNKFTLSQKMGSHSPIQLGLQIYLSFEPNFMGCPWENILSVRAGSMDDDDYDKLFLWYG